MISVCIATHNGEKYISEQIKSILSQLSDKDEIVISDDGSTDSTLEIINSMRDKRIRVFQFVHKKKGKKPHYYVTKNFENALRHCSGDYIFLSDQDDVWCPDKVQECLEVLGDNMAVMHNLECVDENLIPLGKNWYNDDLKFRYHNYLMRRGKHMGCALALRKELLDVILPFPDDLHIHDFWIGLIAESRGGLIYLDKPLIQYRIHSSNISGNAHERNSLLFKLYYRYYTVVHYFLRLCRKLINDKIKI